MKKFNDDEVNVLRIMIHEHENGLPSDRSFQDRQKPLTYHELEVMRRLVADYDRVKAAEVGVKMANVAIKTAGGMNPRSPKTSQLLDDAANLIHNMAYERLVPSRVLGRDWVELATQLRNRARQIRVLGES